MHTQKQNCLPKVLADDKNQWKNIFLGPKWVNENTNYLKVVSTTSGPIKMFEKHSLLFHVISKAFTIQNYLFVIPSNNFRFSCLYRLFHAHFKPKDNRGKHNFEKQYYCRNYSDYVYQCLNVDQILFKIQYLDRNPHQKVTEISPWISCQLVRIWVLPLNAILLVYYRATTVNFYYN